MFETIGFLELNSIAKGVEAADIILKTAQVELIFARAGCPGKYYILVCGEVAAVEAALKAGAETGMSHTVDCCLIPRVHPQVYGADAAVKAADVELLDVRLGTGIGGKSFVVLTGEVAAVKASVEAGIHTENAEGMVVSSVVIPNPRKEIFESLM